MKRYFKGIPQTGFALFELLLVLVLGGCVLLGGFQAYQRMHAERQRIKATLAVRALQIAAAEHFHDQPSVALLIAEKSVSKRVLNNQLIDNFALSYFERPARIICVANVKRSLHGGQRLQLAKALGATLREEDQQLEWQTTPSAVLQPMSQLWSSHAHLQGYIKRVTTHAS